MATDHPFTELDLDQVAGLVIANHPQYVAAYLAGENKWLGFLVGRTFTLYSRGAVHSHVDPNVKVRSCTLSEAKAAVLAQLEASH